MVGGEGLQRFKAIEAPIGEESGLGIGVELVGQAGTRRRPLAPPVLPGQHAAGQGVVRNEGDAETLTGGHDVGKGGPLNHVERALHAGERAQPGFRSDGRGFVELGT